MNLYNKSHLLTQLHSLIFKIGVLTSKVCHLTCFLRNISMYDVILVICASMQVYLCSMASIFSTILLISAVAIILSSVRLDVEPNTSEGLGPKPYVRTYPGFSCPMTLKKISSRSFEVFGCCDASSRSFDQHGEDSRVQIINHLENYTWENIPNPHVLSNMRFTQKTIPLEARCHLYYYLRGYSCLDSSFFSSKIPLDPYTPIFKYRQY